MEILNDKRPIRFHGKIVDIVRNENNYTIFVYGRNFNVFSNRYLAEIRIDSSMLKRLENSIGSNNITRDKFCFIINVVDIKFGYPRLFLDKNEEELSLTYVYKQTLTLFKSNMIDFYQYKNYE